NLPPAKETTHRWSDRWRELTGGRRSSACADIAIPWRQRHTRHPDRLSRRHILPKNTEEARAVGLSDRGRRAVPRGPCAFRLSSWLRSVGTSGVNHHDVSGKSSLLADGLHTRSPHPIRRSRRGRPESL